MFKITSAILSTDFAAALCDPIAYHQESEKRQQQLNALLDEEDIEDVGVDIIYFFLYQIPKQSSPASY